MRVVLAGAGTGGLAAAQGLRRTGVEMVVLKADVDVSATGGYRLHQAPRPARALRTLLTPAVFEKVIASSAGARRSEAAFPDHRGRLLLRAAGPQDEVSPEVHRVTLRAILVDGPGGALRLGTTCTAWDEGDAGVQVEVEGCQSSEADAPVIADGPHPALVHELAGEATDRLSGFVCITGRTAWSDVTPAVCESLRPSTWTGSAATPAGAAAARLVLPVAAAASASARGPRPLTSRLTNA